MKQFLNKLGFRKMDELEQLIALKAQRNTLCYTVLFLLGWSIYNSCYALSAQQKVDLLPSFLLSTIVLVLIFSQLFYQRRLLAGTEDGKAYMRGFWTVILGALAGAAIAVAIGAALVLGGAV